MQTVVTPKTRINTTYDLIEWGFLRILSVRNILLALGVCKTMFSLFKSEEIFHALSKQTSFTILFTSLQAALVVILKTRITKVTIEIQSLDFPATFETQVV